MYINSYINKKHIYLCTTYTNYIHYNTIFFLERFFIFLMFLLKKRLLSFY